MLGLDMSDAGFGVQRSSIDTMRRVEPSSRGFEGNSNQVKPTSWARGHGNWRAHDRSTFRRRHVLRNNPALYNYSILIHLPDSFDHAASSFHLVVVLNILSFSLFKLHVSLLRINLSFPTRRPRFGSHVFNHSHKHCIGFLLLDSPRFLVRAIGAEEKAGWKWRRGGLWCEVGKIEVRRRERSEKSQSDAKISRNKDC